MAYYQQKKGLGNVGSYQISSIPYATSSITVPHLSEGTPLRVDFPMVSKFVTVVNSGSTSGDGRMRVGFSSLGVTGSEVSVGGISGQNYYFTLEEGNSYTADWRVESLYLMMDNVHHGGTASVIAGLTGISSGSISANWSGTIGVG